MVTSIQRWGNSLAVRIPKAFAAEVKLTEDTAVDISIDGDTIVISPTRREWSLEELVKKITPSNRHREISWGPSSGKETW
jgi:antitoxin MazE